ncbi:50S ribosomal protein L29 [Candidatus Pacearchaeota archaeon]|nr:50S ribosomal protein L29 [Candidatus Pacearchaeota archaeon]
MAIIRKKGLRDMNEKTLNERLKDLRFELLRMNAQKSAQMKNVKIRETRKTIARILTLLNQKLKKAEKVQLNARKQENKKQDKEKI